MNISMEVKVPVAEATSAEVLKTINNMGAIPIGGYAAKSDRYGKGVMYVGGNLLRMGKMYFTITLSGEGEDSEIILENVDIGDDFFLASEFAVEVTGVPAGDKVLFRDKEDAIEWLNTRTPTELVQIEVKDKEHGYDGAGLMYL